MLKLVGLSQALEVTSEMLDLQPAIMDLCGHFVVVNNGGNVATIHLTARDYLLNNSSEGRPFKVDRQAAHRQLLLSSMRCLMLTGLRAKTRSQPKARFPRIHSQLLVVASDLCPAR